MGFVEFVWLTKKKSQGETEVTMYPFQTSKKKYKVYILQKFAKGSDLKTSMSSKILHLKSEPWTLMRHISLSVWGFQFEIM